MKIVADENIPQVDRFFSHLGDISTVNGRNLKRAQLVDADLLLVRSVTPVNALLLESTNIKFVATATIGVDHLDIEYLDEMGIGWANAPGSNANSVVEYVLAAICSQEGVMENLLSGAQVGIVGMGNVGSKLYARLCALGINCHAYDPLIDQNTYPVMSSLERVLAADVVCCHAPITYTGPYPSFHLLGFKELSQLKKGAVLINAGRGEVIDNLALKAIINERSDLKVILDVWENEPSIDSELLASVTLGTPHIAGYSYDGKLAGTQMIYQAYCRFCSLQGSENENRITKSELISIELEQVRGLEEGVRSAICAAYAIIDDDRILRNALTKQKMQNGGNSFDQLRKNYPVRREFSNYRIDKSRKLDPKLQTILAAIGFQLDIETKN